jgi:hypothetical protein
MHVCAADSAVDHCRNQLHSHAYLTYILHSPIRDCQHSVEDSHKCQEQHLQHAGSLDAWQRAAVAPATSVGLVGFRCSTELRHSNKTTLVPTMHKPASPTAPAPPAHPPEIQHALHTLARLIDGTSTVYAAACYC